MHTRLALVKPVAALHASMHYLPVVNNHHIPGSGVFSCAQPVQFATVFQDPGSQSSTLLTNTAVLCNPIAQYVQAQKAKPLELAYTALARMAAAMGDGDAALEAAEQGQRAGVPARLRTFAPALLAFAVSGQVDKAFQVGTCLSLPPSSLVKSL